MSDRRIVRNTVRRTADVASPLFGGVELKPSNGFEEWRRLFQLMALSQWYEEGFEVASVIHDHIISYVSIYKNIYTIAE